MTRALPVRLLLICPAESEYAVAADMSRDAGAEVALVRSIAEALDHLRRHGASLIMVDVRFDIRSLSERLRNERLAVPVLACGIEAPAALAVGAIKAGAQDYVPLPPERELLAAAIAMFAERAALIDVERLVGHKVEDVERELILHTLERCRGNRTTASTILGISVRTMRNKLRTFIEAGIPVAPAPFC